MLTESCLLRWGQALGFQEDIDSNIHPSLTHQSSSPQIQDRTIGGRQSAKRDAEMRTMGRTFQGFSTLGVVVKC